MKNKREEVKIRRRGRQRRGKEKPSKKSIKTINFVIQFLLRIEKAKHQRPP